MKFFTARKTSEFYMGEDDFFVVKKNNVDDTESLDAIYHRGKWTFDRR